MSNTEKNIMVLSRRDPLEAMRIAAGLTIFGHSVRLVFMGGALSEQEMQSEHAELLDLAGIEPETTNGQMAELLDHLKPAALAAAINESDGVISI
ncbi:MAG: hypothetical protein HKN11_04795 [Rhizobiales bacterium]|nr:hypothetical protein [Hyphomicrobiales bacterium]